MDPSSFTKTSFCGKTVDNVTNNEVKEFILNDMKLKWVMIILKYL